MEYRYRAIILSKKDIGETDRLYTFYTLEEGKVQALARGVRKSGARLAASLENFSLVSISVMRRKGLGNIASVIVERNNQSYLDSLEVLRDVFEVAGIVDRLIEIREPDKRIFLLLDNFFIAVEQALTYGKAGSVGLLSQAFLFHLFYLLGHALEVARCVGCSCRVQEHSHYLSFREGGILCDDCARSVGDRKKVSPDITKILRLAIKHQPVDMLKLQVSKSIIRSLRSLSREYLHWIR